MHQQRRCNATCVKNARAIFFGTTATENVHSGINYQIRWYYAGIGCLRSFAEVDAGGNIKGRGRRNKIAVTE